MDGCWHCIHPEFLQDQLARSLERLRLETLDVCLLHNPEYFFSDAMRRRSGDLEELRGEFYRRLAQAFVFFEAQVSAGRIAWYGVSSNTAVRPPDDPEATSLSRMLDAAVAAGGPGHHFRVVQVPMNLLETGAARQANTGADAAQTVLAWAAESGIAVLTNRPLNAYANGTLIRLADVPLDDTEGVPAPDEALPRVAALEEEFRLKIGSRLRVAEGGPPPAEWFCWADRLGAMAGRLQGVDHWRRIEERTISPAVSRLVQMLDRSLSGPIQETWRSWLEQYLSALDAVLRAFRARAARQSQAVSNRVTAALNPHLPLAKRGESLSRKALWVLLSTPGVTTVLLGMRHPDYVADGMEVLKWLTLGDVGRIYDAMRDVRVG